MNEYMNVTVISGKANSPKAYCWYGERPPVEGLLPTQRISSRHHQRHGTHMRNRDPIHDFDIFYLIYKLETRFCIKGEVQAPEIMNIHKLMNLGPPVIILGPTTRSTLWLMISSANSWLRGRLTLGLNLGTSLLILSYYMHVWPNWGL
jgi:hypothetical protein